MITTPNAYLNAPFAQGTPVPPTTATPVLTSPLALPQAPGQDDGVVIFLSTLRRTTRDGDLLADAFPRLMARAPQVGAEVLRLATSGGAISLGLAIESVRTYAATRVAVMPGA